MGIRFIKLLKILIKIGIMFLVMAGIILINKKYMSDADGCERDGIPSVRMTISKEMKYGG